MKALLMILSLSFMSSAFAKDSDWKLCVGDVVLYEETVKLVVNLYEHRNAEGGRSTDLTLIYGGNVLVGGFNSTESDEGPVTLKNENSFFRGSAKVSYENETLTLLGRLSLFGSVTPLKANLKCKTLQN